jgi:hypothetical protein
MSKSQTVDKLREIFKDMPPFIKLTSRRARKTLAKYEATKKIHIEQLRDNATFKFVMMVAGLTNEPMEKYWKGDSVDPFSDKYGQSSNTKICKEDLEILLKRARENSFADLHQFCRNVEAIPMYRKAKEDTISAIGDLVPKSWWFESYVSDSDDSDYVPDESESDDDKLHIKFTEKTSSNSSSDTSSDEDAGAGALSESRREKAVLEQELKECGGDYSDNGEDTAAGALSECRREKAELEQKLEDCGGDYSDNGEDTAARKLSECRREKAELEEELEDCGGDDKDDDKDEDDDVDPERLRRKISNCRREKAELEEELGNCEGDDEYEDADDEEDEDEEIKIRYFVKYVYNMADEEFHDFTELFMNAMKKAKEDKKPPPSMRRFVLGRDLGNKNPDKDEIQNPFPAHSHFRGQRDRAYTRADWYNDFNTDGIVPGSREGEWKDGSAPGSVPAWEDSTRLPQNRRPNNHSVDRIFDPNRVEKEGYDHPDGYVTLKRSNWWQWSNSMPIVRWEGGRDHHPEFWFQRYLARWLTRDANTTSSNNKRPVGPTPTDMFKDLEPFKNKYQGLFNNLWFKESQETREKNKKRVNQGKRAGKKQGKWMRNLTGLRLTKFVREPVREAAGETVYSTYESKKETTYPKKKGKLSAKHTKSHDTSVIPQFPNNQDPFDDCAEVCEVPLDFVKPLFEERFAYWKHELVLGEYEKRAMYTADQWLQKTPWAIGKIYLMPSIFAHMQEAHIAIISRYKKFSHLKICDWFYSERQRYFFAKLVALCIRTSAVLSNKRYGLDKAYMRLNLEKKRIMYAIGKLEAPQRTRQAAAFPRATGREQDAWQNYAAARQRGDGAAASNALRDMDMRHVPSGENTLRRMF